jgi:hypothetical protein
LALVGSMGIWWRASWTLATTPPQRWPAMSRFGWRRVRLTRFVAADGFVFHR